MWEHFEPELVEVDGALKAVCRYCGMKMASGKSGTNSLRNHIKDSCRKISADDRQRFIATIQKQPAGPFTFNPQISRELMITWCIRADVAFNKFEDPSFFYHGWHPCSPHLIALGAKQSAMIVFVCMGE